MGGGMQMQSLGLRSDVQPFSIYGAARSVKDVNKSCKSSRERQTDDKEKRLAIKQVLISI